MRHEDPALGEEIFDVSEAEAEAVREERKLTVPFPGRDSSFSVAFCPGRAARRVC
jgi:hypothetical protein